LSIGGRDVKVRGLELNNRIPAVCVPVTDTACSDITEHIRDLSSQTDMIEWRMDFFEDIASLEKLPHIFKEVRTAAGDTPLICTLRTQKEGGRYSGNDYEDVLKACAASGCADIVDIEYDTISHSRSFISEISGSGVKTILSHHDFKMTPDGKTMFDYLEGMRDAGADIVKLAVMPQDALDVERLLGVTVDFHLKYPNTPEVTMSMGKTGVISRVSGGTSGSCITFGADKEASAPGQLDYLELKEIIRILAEAGRD